MTFEVKGVSYEVPINEPLQNRDPAGLYPPFRRMLEAYLEAAQPLCPHTLKIGECRRTPERQRWLYSLGRVQPGKVVTKTLESRHLVGLAADLVMVDADGNAVWEDEVWEALHAAAPPPYFGLKSFTWDRPHLELHYADALIARAAEFGLEQL